MIPGVVALAALLLPMGVAASEPAPASAPDPGYVPAVIHVTTDPLLPQKYRTVRAGTYPCSVVILVSKEGKATDVVPKACDQDAFYALATAILQWEFDPATRDGVAIDSELPYTNEFEVKTLLPRKHVVGFVGGAVSAGGAGLVGVEGRIHLGERISFTGGIDWDSDTFTSDLSTTITPVVRGDFTLSSRRQYTDRRGIYGMTLGAFGDGWGAFGTYGGFRGEVMTPAPGLSIGGDAGLAALWGRAQVFDDAGIWQRAGQAPFLPWLRLSVIWYAPVPRDQFMVVPRPHDPVVYEAPMPEPEVVVDVDGAAFDGIPAVHWSQIWPSNGSNTPTGPGFDVYPPGTYTCNVRVAISPEGKAAMVRVEKCPEAGKADAKANALQWVWPPRPTATMAQAVFRAPIFVQHDDAIPVKAQSVLLREGEATQALPPGAGETAVWVHEFVPPIWASTRPTRSCYVDVDIDTSGQATNLNWVSGDIEVQPRVMEALRQWVFYPVAVDGELRPVRARLSMCDYPASIVEDGG